jgi:hypothetical protein
VTVCNGGRGTRADCNPRYSTRGKDKVCLFVCNHIVYSHLVAMTREGQGLVCNHIVFSHLVAMTREGQGVEVLTGSRVRFCDHGSEEEGKTVATT